MTRYIIGISRSLAGFTPEDVNNPWDFYISDEDNILQGNLPGGSLLWWSRFPNVLLAAFTGLILFFLIKLAFGRLPAYILVILYANSPFFLLNLRRAMSESPLLFFILLCTFITFAAVRQWFITAKLNNPTLRDLKKTFILFTFAGICAGLAGLCKINGLLMTGGIALVCLFIAVAFSGNVSREIRISFVIRTCAVVILTSLAIFILFNPFLYSHPLTNTGRMYKFRLHEMSIQIERYPDQLIHDIKERLTVPLREILLYLTPFQFTGSIWINLILSLTGLTFAIRVIRSGDIDNNARASAITMLIIPLPMSLAAWMTPLNWDRYYLIPIAFSMVYLCIGISFIIKWIASKLGTFHIHLRNQTNL